MGIDAQIKICQVNNVDLNLQNFFEQFHNSIPFPLDIVGVEENTDSEAVLEDSQEEQEELSKADRHNGNFECRDGDVVQEVIDRTFPQSETSQRRFGRWYSAQNSRARIFPAFRYQARPPKCQLDWRPSWIRH